ncbi:MAG TPA: metalloregulator ArsR/SmtB family transcription factor, partial [Polyangiales bacterium]|nr:metalloregulator ArsR/SmtB family transcription factor [Polyangiales bacterium]
WIRKASCGGSCNGSRVRVSALSTLDRTLTALADPTRRSVIDLLREEPRKASDLADALEMSRPAMSRHLRVLRKSGLVSETDLPDDARVRVYRLERARFNELRDWLEEVEAFWGDQLVAFKRHAERRAKRSP